MFVDNVTDAPHQIDLRVVHARATWMAPLARAKASLLGRFGNGEEFDLLALRTPCRTRWPAVDSRRAHRENKTAVTRSVTREHGIPHLGIVHHAGHYRRLL